MTVIWGRYFCVFNGQDEDRSTRSFYVTFYQSRNGIQFADSFEACRKSPVSTKVIRPEVYICLDEHDVKGLSDFRRSTLNTSIERPPIKHIGQAGLCSIAHFKYCTLDSQ